MGWVRRMKFLFLVRLFFPPLTSISLPPSSAQPTRSLLSFLSSPFSLSPPPLSLPSRAHSPPAKVSDKPLLLRTMASQMNQQVETFTVLFHKLKRTRSVSFASLLPAARY